jgi:transposase
MRQALNTLAVVVPDWLRAQAAPEWIERYARRFELTRLPESAARREALAREIGADGCRLLAALWAPEAPPAARALPAVEILRQVWVQQFYQDATQCRLREVDELPPAPLVIASPYDAEARYSEKRHLEWVGYTFHVTETCDPELPRLITDVQTTPAPVPDTEVLPQIQADLQKRDLLPRTHLADRGYTEAAALVQSQRDYGIQLVGPLAADTSWQARAGTGFAAAAFSVDWERQEVTCPAGQQSHHWHETVKHGHRVIQIDFAGADCRTCPHRAGCTRSQRAGRRLTLLAPPEGPALQAARAWESTAAFAAAYAPRAGVEATHGQALRRCGLRQCRYVGEAKTRLQHYCTAAALNFVRVAEWLLGNTPAQTRRSAFVRLRRSAFVRLMTPAT